VAPRSLYLALWLVQAAGAQEIRDVLKSAEIERRLAGAGEVTLESQPNYAIVLRSEAGKGSPRAHSSADEIWWVRGGQAKVSLGTLVYDVAGGDVLRLPRNTRHAVEGSLKYLAVRVFPLSGRPHGLFPDKRMPEVLKKAAIEATIAGNDTNQPLHSAPNFTLNHVIYAGKSGPWEAHRDCVDIYFIQHGSGKAHLGGAITNPKEVSPGEIRGAGVSGSRAHEIAPGDLVVIPRMGAHYVTPAAPKLAYLLIKVWAD